MRARRLRLALLRAFAALTRPLRSPRLPALRDAPRILVIRPDHIGDLLFATPALRVLRKAYPDAHLAGLVGSWAKPLLEHNPNLDEIIVCEFPGFSRKPKASLLAPYQELWRTATGLRSSHFDMVIVLRFDHWWGALLAYVAGIPRRVGYAISECQPFLTQAVPYVSQRHEVLQDLTLIEQAIREGGRSVPADTLALEFAVTDEDQRYADELLMRQGVAAGSSLVAIHPGAGAPVKLWRPEAFAEVADAITNRQNAAIVITGSRAELDQAWAVYARMRSDPIIAAGETSLGQLAALFRRCRLVIGPDCGPLHLAVAVGTPTVHLYGPVDPLKFGPWGGPERHRVLTSQRTCIPCNRLDYSLNELPDHPCVQEVSPEAAVQASERLLALG